MDNASIIADLATYHRDMGRELAETIVTAAAGEGVSSEALAVLTEAARVQMVSDIRANLQNYGAVPVLIAGLCNAASDAMKARLADLAPNGLHGNV